MNPTIEAYCRGDYAPRAHTDRLFPLEPGGYDFRGPMMDQIRLIERVQLLDQNLWALFVRQFRLGSVDDADKGWRCEYWGKMLRGGVFVWQCTRDEALYDALTATVRDMLTTQDAQGRFSTYSVEAEFNGWDIWGRKYILLGMEYYLEICRDPALRGEILAALTRHADYMLSHLGPAEEGKLEINEASSHWAGLNSSSVLEPMVRLYSLTGERRYLDFAAYIVSRGGCSAGNLFEMAWEDKLDPYQYPVTKAYEMMSCFEGLLEYYRVTGIEKWREAVVRFARRVAGSDITVIGCAGCTHELFDHSTMRQVDETERGIMQETCVTVTWMKLCSQLLQLTGDPFFAEQMERSFWNALSGAVNTEGVPLNNGLPFDSYSPLLPGTRGRATGGFKRMQDGTFYGCCACIASAGLGLVGRSGALLSREGLCLNWYLPGEVRASTPSGAPLGLILETDYPLSGAVHLRLSLDSAEEFTLSLRVPSWSEDSALAVNGEPVSCAPGGYASLRRLWKDGDRLQLSLDMRVRSGDASLCGLSGEEAARFITLRRGPIVLARDARLENDVDSPIAPASCPQTGCVPSRIRALTPFPCVVPVDVLLLDGRWLPLVDYASAGKTWDEASRMCAWSHAVKK